MKIRIHKKFKPLFKEQTRYYIITGERGSSKSFSVNIYLTLKLLQANQTILFTRYTLASTKDSIIPEFKEKIELLNLVGRLDIQQYDITNHKNSSKILFRGIKTSAGLQTAKLKSLTNVNIFVIDEAEEFIDEDEFNKIDLSIRTKVSKNLVILILNPTNRRHWIYKRFFEGKVHENYNGVLDNVTYINTTILDNKDNIDKDLLNELLELKQADPKRYKKRVLSGWLDDDETIVFNYEKLKRFKEVDYKNAEVVAYCDVADQGIDFLCFTIGAIIGANIFIIDVLFTQKDSNYSMPYMLKMFDKYNISKAVFEANNQGLIYAKMIKEKLNPKHRITGITNTTNKHSRIVVQSDYILDNFYFKDTDDKMYNAFLEQLSSYRNDKKSKHDDAADSIAGLSRFIRKVILR